MRTYIGHIAVRVVAEDNKVLLEVLSRGQGDDGRDDIRHQTRNNLDMSIRCVNCMHNREKDFFVSGLLVSLFVLSHSLPLMPLPSVC